MNTQALLTKMLQNKTFTPVAIVPYSQPDTTAKSVNRSSLAHRVFVGTTMHVLK